MFTSEDISPVGGGDEYVTPVNAILGGGHLTSFHGSLQGVDGTISEFGLCHGVVDVAGGDRQGLLGEHLGQVVHTLLGEAVDSLEVLLLAPISFCLWPRMAASR